MPPNPQYRPELDRLWREHPDLAGEEVTNLNAWNHMTRDTPVLRPDPFPEGTPVMPSKTLILYAEYLFMQLTRMTDRYLGFRDVTLISGIESSLDICIYELRYREQTGAGITLHVPVAPA